jgi:hypothetical protein
MTMSGFARAVIVTAVVTVPLTVAGCKPIDKSQWRDLPLSTATTGTSTTTATSGSTTTTTTRVVVVDPSDVSGVIAGASRGSRRGSTATVLVGSDPATCWTLVVDANFHRGCGNASITDTYGDRAGRVTKLSGGDTIQLSLLSDGQTVTSSQVSSINHYVTVRG